MISMEANTVAKGILIATYRLLMLSLGVFLFYKLQELIIHLAIAAVLALLGRPIVIFLERKLKFSALWSATTTLIIFITLMIGII